MSSKYDVNPDSWGNPQNVTRVNFTCGYCGIVVAPSSGFTASELTRILICPNCNHPTYFAGRLNLQVPPRPYGRSIQYLPGDVAPLYEEIRTCLNAGAYTAAVLVCRKLLMHIAVEKGAHATSNFLKCVEYLDQNHYTPPNSQDWVDDIRKKGNEANHEVVMMTEATAGKLLEYVEILLTFNYEFPGRRAAARPANP